MAFFNRAQEEKQHGMHENEERMLTLVRSFEARLWELDVQVHHLKCVGFERVGPPRELSDLVLRCSQVKVAVVQRRADGGFFPLSPWSQARPMLLAQQVGVETFELTLVTTVPEGEARQPIFSSPVTLQDLKTVVDFLLSYHQWWLG